MRWVDFVSVHMYYINSQGRRARDCCVSIAIIPLDVGYAAGLSSRCRWAWLIWAPGECFRWDRPFPRRRLSTQVFSNDSIGASRFPSERKRYSPRYRYRPRRIFWHVSFCLGLVGQVVSEIQRPTKGHRQGFLISRHCDILITPLHLIVHGTFVYCV